MRVSRWNFLFFFSITVPLTGFTAAQEGGISILAPPTQDAAVPAHGAVPSKETATVEGKKTNVRVEVSRFQLPEEDGGDKGKGKSKTLVLAKIYDAKEAMGNSYVIHIEGESKATILDPGYNGQAIAKYLDHEKLTPDALLLTSGHFMRIADIQNLKNQFPEIKVAVAEADAEMLSDPKHNQSDFFGGVTSPKPDIELQGGEVIETSGSITWMVLSTPGFTPGSLSYQINTKDRPVIFTGDFIYREGTSGTTLPMSDADVLDMSLQVFLQNEPAEAIIYPGFGPNTTVEDFYKTLETQAQLAQSDDDDVAGDLAVDSLSLSGAVNSAVYQTKVVEVYPTTTYFYNDLWVPYYPSFGYRVWGWYPIRPLPPPPPRWDVWIGLYPYSHYSHPWPRAPLYHGDRYDDWRRGDRRDGYRTDYGDRYGRGPGSPNRPYQPGRPVAPIGSVRPGDLDRPGTRPPSRSDWQESHRPSPSLFDSGNRIRLPEIVRPGEDRFSSPSSLEARPRPGIDRSRWPGTRTPSQDSPRVPSITTPPRPETDRSRWPGMRTPSQDSPRGLPTATPPRPGLESNRTRAPGLGIPSQGATRGQASETFTRPESRRPSGLGVSSPPQFPARERSSASPTRKEGGRPSGRSMGGDGANRATSPSSDVGGGDSGSRGARGARSERE